MVLLTEDGHFPRTFPPLFCIPGHFPPQAYSTSENFSHQAWAEIPCNA